MVACMNHTRPLTRGFSLVEAAIVLAVVGVVIGAIWVGAAKMIEDYKVDKTVEGVLEIVRNTQKLISIRDSEVIGNNQRLTATLIASSVQPKDWIHGTNTIKNQFSGKVEVYNLVISDNNFNVRLYGIPVSSCIALISKIGSTVKQNSTLYSGSGLGYVATYIGSPEVLYWNTKSFPISPQQAATACNGDISYFRFVFGYTRIN